ncbi:hypothetical protein ES703_09898 [subsurface metagenome]
MNEKKFIPTQSQIKFAEIYLNYKKPKTLKEISKKVGVDTSTIWRWFNKDSEFSNWINNLARELLSKNLAKLYMVALREAESGQFNFVRLLLEISGEYTPTSHQRFAGSVKIGLGETEGVKKEIMDKLNAMAKRSKRSKERKKGK